MKKFTFLLTILFTCFILPSHAFEGHGFRVLSETIESSPGAVGGFQKIDSKSTKKARNVAFTWSQAYDAEGRAGDNVVVKGSHSFNVTNYTKQKQTYTYTYELNCDGQYFRKIDRVELQPGGVVSDASASYLSTYHRAGGLYRINAVTGVSGESSNNHVGSAMLRVRG